MEPHQRGRRRRFTRARWLSAPSRTRPWVPGGHSWAPMPEAQGSVQGGPVQDPSRVTWALLGHRLNETRASDSRLTTAWGLLSQQYPWDKLRDTQSNLESCLGRTYPPPMSPGGGSRVPGHGWFPQSLGLMAAPYILGDITVFHRCSVGLWHSHPVLLLTMAVMFQYPFFGEPITHTLKHSSPLPALLSRCGVRFQALS